MSIRFKISNFRPNDGRIAYGDSSGPDTGEVGSQGRLHLGDRAVKQADAAAEAHDPIVIFQSLYPVGVCRLITHVVMPTGPVVLAGAHDEEEHRNLLPVRVLARIRLPLLAPVPHPVHPHARKATKAPSPAVPINDVLWKARQPVAPGWTLQLGAPFASYAGAAVCTERLVRVLQNGQFDLAGDTLSILKAASEAGLNH